MHRLTVGAIALAFSFAISASAIAAPLFNPTDFTSLGTANILGTTKANTDTLTLDGFSGVLDQGFAVFDFANFTIAAGADLSVTGSNGLVVLSRDSIDIIGTLDLSALFSETEFVAANNFALAGELLPGSGSLTVNIGSIIPSPPGAVPPVMPPDNGNPPPPIITISNTVPEAPSAFLLASFLISWWFLRNVRFLRQY